MIQCHPKLWDSGEIFRLDLEFLKTRAEVCTKFMDQDSIDHANQFLQDTAHLGNNSTRMDYWKNLLDFMSHWNNGNFEAVGFKWMMNQCLVDVVPEAIDYFKKEDFRVIILDRENYLRQAISVEALKQAPGSAHESSATTERPKVDIDADTFLRFFEVRSNTEANYKLIESKVNNTMRISYSQLMENPASTVHDVFTFLDLEQTPVKTDDFVKTHVGAVGDYVKDWEKVRAQLMKTEWADKVKEWEVEETSQSSEGAASLISVESTVSGFCWGIHMKNQH
eukprot:CAMPEP_0197524938 /NCGR_PEP_ID=MMETSP1318-20131121/10412_1 /TAXON_ID=552666 /ORGANISM="Partenskyella glossopodia, Strain RCC365" /LENGTH=279 /DNA_ID=CAMNT_0043078039 /DNA_START=237 /DNA_END=1076 /DNA_ORIENTATION=-